MKPVRLIFGVFRFLAGFGIFAIAVPILLIQLAGSLFLATVVGVFVYGFFRAGVLGIDAFDDPTTILGWIGFVLIFLTCWATMVSVWAWYTGIALWFAARGDSHGSARIASKAERRDLQTGTGLPIGRDADSGRLLRYDGIAWCANGVRV